MRKRLVVHLIASLTFGATILIARQSPSSTAPQANRANQIHVDVIVRDKTDTPIPALTREDFEIREYSGGSRNTPKIATVTFERPLPDAMPSLTLPLLNPAGMTTKDLAGRRAWVLLFDTSALDRDGLTRAVRAASAWLTEKITSADLVGVASIDATLTPILDLTNDKARVLAALNTLAANGAPMTEDANAPEIDGFNNDARLRGITAICNALVQSDQRKALVFFSASREHNGPDNQLVVRLTERACQQAHVLISTIDMRPVDAAMSMPVQPSGGGIVNVQSGMAVARNQTLKASVSPLVTSLDLLASLTGGTTRKGGDAVGLALDEELKSTSSYYILGYVSTTAGPDEYRQINVRLKNNPLGYEVDRPYDVHGPSITSAHDAQPATGNREKQLMEQFRTATPAMDVPLLVRTGAFRLGSHPNNRQVGGPVSVNSNISSWSWSTLDSTSFPLAASPYDDHNFYVPISIELPSSVSAANGAQTFDVRVCLAGRDLCSLNDSRESALIKSTIAVPPPTGQSARAPVRYQTGLVIPAGQHLLRVAVRDNATGRMGSFNVYLVVPDPIEAPVHVSSVVLSTESRPTQSKSRDDLLSHDGMELLLNPSGLVRQDQTMRVHYEVYDPSGGLAPKVATHVTFYRGTEKAFETPVIQRTKLDDTERHAAIFDVDVPASSFAPGFYICEIAIADELAGTSTTRRLDVYVHPK